MEIPEGINSPVAQQTPCGETPSIGICAFLSAGYCTKEHLRNGREGDVIKEKNNSFNSCRVMPHPQPRSWGRASSVAVACDVTTSRGQGST